MLQACNYHHRQECTVAKSSGTSWQQTAPACILRTSPTISQQTKSSEQGASPTNQSSMCQLLFGTGTILAETTCATKFILGLVSLRVWGDKSDEETESGDTVQQSNSRQHQPYSEKLCIFTLLGLYKSSGGPSGCGTALF